MTTITVPRALLEQALEAMYEETAWFGPTPKGAAAITALRAALAQQAELQTTHSAECWRWHHKCAIAEVERLRAALEQQADRMRAKWEAVGAAVEGADRDSRGMFVARLENMQKHGDHWLTVQAVLALLNDCDMLAARERA